MTEMLRILFVEDDEDDYVVTRDLLSDAYGKRFELDWTITQEAALDAMNRKKYDLCFIDYRLGGSNGLDLVREAFAQGFTAPILMLTGLDNRELDLAAMKLGVSDYLVKSELTAPLLERAIRYALARKKVEQDLALQARYDVLTGLANRALFRERLERGLEQAKRMSCPLAVLLLDLDHFKDINDTLGHPVGDRLLKQVAERLLRALRKTDTLARLGGDEFALVASLTQVEDASLLAGKIVQALEAPVYLNDHRIFVSASLGMTLFPLDGQDPDQLLHNADMALYQAKAQGRHTFCFYDPAMEARVQARKTLEAAIRLALERQEFRLHFQPKVNIYSGEVMGIEALLRWQHPERGEIPPLEFLPLAVLPGALHRIENIAP
jgi:diguanylate cyclase (GGDEF)-like protein